MLHPAPQAGEEALTSGSRFKGWSSLLRLVLQELVGPGRGVTWLSPSRAPSVTAVLLANIRFSHPPSVLPTCFQTIGQTLKGLLEEHLHAIAELQTIPLQKTKQAFQAT